MTLPFNVIPEDPVTERVPDTTSTTLTVPELTVSAFVPEFNVSTAVIDPALAVRKVKGCVYVKLLP